VCVFVVSRLGHTPLPPSPINNAEYDEFCAVRLEDVDVIATLGMGGFGRVELVRPVTVTCPKRQARDPVVLLGFPDTILKLLHLQALFISFHSLDTMKFYRPSFSCNTMCVYARHVGL